MKKNYIQPAFEVMTMQIASTICSTSNASFSIVPGNTGNPGDNLSDPGDGR